MYQRERLFSRLGHFAYQSFVEATKLCRTFRHEYVELEHWLKVLVDKERGDLPLILAHYEVNIQRISDALDRILHTLPNRTNAVVDLSAQLETVVERGLLMSQLAEFPGGGVRTIHILVGILQDATLQRGLYRLSDEFKKIPIPQVFDDYPSLLANSVEYEEMEEIAEGEYRGDASGSADGEDILDQWCADLTRQARAGEIDPVIGREAELRQVIDILLRRRQNNPILVGEAGVGKTAVAEALACKIAAGQVPPLLQGARLLSLDLGRMQAGASMRGEFESRLKALIDAITRSGVPVILFCDEAHTLVGAGGQTGTGDAVNLLKPMLARGTLRMVAATTWSEYKQFIEPDAALTRRFQYVLVSEPDEENAVNMMRAISPHFARHHNVIIRESALQAAVHLSLRHLPSRQLPDKAISLLDTACARVALSQHAQPEKIESLEAGLAVMQTEVNSLQDEVRFAGQAPNRMSELQNAIFAKEQLLAGLRRRQEQERLAVTQLREAEQRQPDRLPLLAEQLGELQAGDLPLVYPWVDDRVVAEVLSDWTGIPTGRMLQNDLDNALNLDQLLERQIFGQTTAINEIAQAVRISRAGIQAHDRPLGVFMLSGPSGVGKTETAFALAEAMYGGAHNLIVFNMSEFQESHTVSTLKGAPPGYVGYGKGGKLTEAVRRKPYSIVLLDEFDKAHPDIHEVFYQVFDKGVMEDGEGRMISFRQCFILMTCNVGAAEIEATLSETPELKTEALRPMLHDALVRVFPPALLARMNMIPYVPLSIEAITHIAAKQISRLQQRLQKEVGVSLVLEGDISGWIAQRVSTHPSRGRAVESLLQQAILPPISNEVLQRKRTGQELKNIQLMVENESLSVYFD
ncbi:MULTISPECIES: type VI secretion system ATPase TssH [unclassified Serratia (in: enterobacteria)]|uniref:type VI secretion system ATPase TssH n=1 Tax=unclassified Serratia (in: enterobacteria) TaxID=2647522 RepID=UPI002ED1CE8C|nr:type VI secretion system ATPase TssH [Serratia sp. C2(2)]MEE4445832.1 type VI secretion system ATPase TssH [Serratia sp. C2(1)]